MVSVSVPRGAVTLRYSGLNMVNLCEYNYTVSVYNGAPVTLNVWGSVNASSNTSASGQPYVQYQEFLVLKILPSQTGTQPSAFDVPVSSSVYSPSQCPVASIVVYWYYISHSAPG